MYYCPCPCSDPIDPDAAEENSYFTLPRNLSYVQESFLDAHDVSGRFVYNPRTERRIAANAAATNIHSNPTNDLNADDDDDDDYLYHHHLYRDHHCSNGGVANGNNITTTAIITSANTTVISSTTTTPSSSSHRWRADGTKVELEFERGITYTGRYVSSRDFESRQQEVINRDTNIGEKGEGDTGECVGVKTDDNNDDGDGDDENVIDFLSVLKSRRDPTVHFGSVSPPNVVASDFGTKSSVSGVQSQKENGLPCDQGVNKNSSSSGNSDSNTDLNSGTLSSTTTVTTSSSSSSASSSSHSSSTACNVNASSSPASPPSSSSSSTSTSSSSKSSFLRRMTSLLSPKDEDNTSVNSPHQHVLDLGSSVDAAESSTNDPDLTSDTADPSQPLILRSPDRSGLIMDRGEDLILNPSTDHDDEESALLSCTTSGAGGGCGSCGGVDSKSMHDACSFPEPDSFAGDGPTIHCRSCGDAGEEVIVVQYGQGGGQSAPDPDNCEDEDNNQSKPSGEVVQLSRSPPEYYNETLIEATRFGVVMSESDKTLVVESQNTKATIELYESSQDADSDVFSEEGVFVNMIDDGDVTMDRRASDVSDDTVFSVDSMFCTPKEQAEQEKTIVKNADEDPIKTKVGEDSPTKKQLVRQMSLEEAISRAASDFDKMTMIMYPDLKGEDSKTKVDSPTTSKNWERRERSERLQKLARGSHLESPTLSVRMTTAPSDVVTDPSFQDQLMDNCSESPIYEDHEFNFNKHTLRKSTSLKTNKTPPGTPHRKKVVRFADAMGLDLESVRHVINTESPPKIPASAMADLQQGLRDDRLEIGSRYLTACFTQPGATNNFVNSVIALKVRLENAIITDLTITGFIRVSNVEFHKSVRVRYTHNAWATFHDIAASYIQDSCDGPTDRFSFSIVAPAHFAPGNRLQFAVSYKAGDTEYWDNNGGENYVFECFAKTVPTDNDREWIHFL